MRDPNACNKKTLQSNYKLGPFAAHRSALVAGIVKTTYLISNSTNIT